MAEQVDEAGDPPAGERSVLRLAHSSDWHLGALFEGASRAKEHALFLEWFVSWLKAEAIDVLLLCGDVFDQANPTAEAQGLYYRFLVSLKETQVRQVVVIAGNHDSPARLEAPRELLAELGVHVVGAATEEVQDSGRLLCPIPTKDESGVEAVVVALPYVHEYRLGIRTTGLSRSEVAQSFEERFKQLYSRCADEARTRYGEVPIIGMGHLSCVGATEEDYPLPIHRASVIGGLPDSVVDPRLTYLALGHIHRCMQVGTKPAWYCGTPVPMNLREATSPRHVLRLDLEAGGLGPVRPVPVAVPLFRPLVEFQGSPEELISKVDELTWDTPLPPYLCATLVVPHAQPDAVERLRNACATRWTDHDEGPRLVRLRQQLPATARRGAAADMAQLSLRAMTPREVFGLLCAQRGEVLDESLSLAFDSLLQSDGPRG